jgi:hypothetical protein
VVTAQNKFAVAVGDARLAHAQAVAAGTTTHDKALAGDNQTYQDQLPAATETRAN